MRPTRHGTLQRRSPLRAAVIAAVAAAVWGMAAPAVSAASATSEAPPAAEFRFADDAAASARTLAGAAAEGHLTLEFAAESAGEDESGGVDVGYQLQRSLDPGFLDAVIHHDGPSDRVFVSGLPEGTHHFRVRARAAASADDPEAWGPWSEAATFEVRHQSMGLTWTLFGSGAALFVVLVLIIGRESARESAADRATPGAGRA